MKMEVLSPAGDLKIAKAAYVSGADAVYFGGMDYGARAMAANFDNTAIEELLDFAHLRGKKAYITVNTLIKNPEGEKRLYDFMKPIYELGIDGVIIQDFGVLTFLKRHFPDLPLHASTQMNLCTPYGAKFLKEAGACRIVTAREISLKEIQGIKKETDLEIETFVHGALCMSYSGTCLLSSFIGGRSGNRGRCAQPCRLGYAVLDEKKRPLP
nr:U32 family peptidase [Lachnospiraceae bacterium]